MLRFKWRPRIFKDTVGGFYQVPELSGENSACKILPEFFQVACQVLETDEWIHVSKMVTGGHSEDAGKKWFTLRSLGIFYQRTPGGCAQQYKAVLYTPRLSFLGKTKQTNELQNSPRTSGETEGTELRHEKLS